METYKTREHPRPQAKRKALFLNLEPGTAIADELARLNGWILHEVNSLEQADKALLQQNYFVGIAHFDWSDPLTHQEFSTFFQQHNQIAWIALIRPEYLRDIALRRALFENFYDYFSLPLGDNIINLETVLGHAYGIYHLQQLESDDPGINDEFQMVGTSQEMLSIFDQVRKVAKTDAAVLITGESGTGKELIARAIHQRSKRGAYPFVAVNCGSLPETLIHSELFGYEKGAFTGAAQRRLGRIEAADQGSLFLDEIGDLDLNLQAHLLRFLQEGTIERLGNNTPMQVDVRVIAATNIDLVKAVEQGRFREDLFYRLSVLNIDLPPLRNRGEDKELLARFFFKKFSSDHNGQLRGFTDEAINAIIHHSWPGNVRELINRVRRGMIMSDNKLITPQDLNLSPGLAEKSEPIRTLSEARSEAEKRAISATLHRFDHNISRAAKALGVSRVTLYRMMEKHHLHDKSSDNQPANQI
ncbi:DNA-binding transcriptional response regulator, NtrC family, contains REC, AAA-type ATPase, and a Fis-type DNA-binding domains [Marinobacterium lutimaris]|uniref:DNA-binding transcriptional response regulator, NtrC family, contains REC, AAA-type ATPase, and a Fis-type DNA-binding domains n=2 Tax=Marinobacterium lutimaris TaxID=568106 RepID=A0A1H5WYF0_9GAMM|nr:DNA-binding transcriptional response regulator, NtrC family, contains REC, AAA-type ATPase, and a Fis-type DNA-binding domains [Marinobacterium lutimaris]